MSRRAVPTFSASARVPGIKSILLIKTHPGNNLNFHTSAQFRYVLLVPIMQDLRLFTGLLQLFLFEKTTDQLLC